MPFLFSSCGSSRKAHSGRRKAPISVTPDNNPPVSEKEVEVIDTAVWTEIPDAEAYPVTSPKEGDLKYRSELKSLYNIAMFAPFRANNVIKGAEITNGYKRFIDFYLGMKLAAKALELDGVSLNVKVFDTEYDDAILQKELNDPFLEVADVIIGPYKRANVKSTIEFARRKQKTMVSPWISSNTLATENPYYVQIKPSLTRHYTAIRDHIINSELVQNTVFVCKEGEAEKWKELRDIFSLSPDSENNIPFFSDTLFISPDSLGPESTVFVNLLESKENPVLFIPYPSSQDEDFVYTLLRKLNIDKGEKELILYGPGTWVAYRDAVLDLFNTLDIRLSISNLYLPSDERFKALRTSFFNDFGTNMSSDAIEGFDLMYYIGRSLKENGTYFHAFPSSLPWELNQSGFDIRPVTLSHLEDDIRIDFYENFYIQIMEYTDFQFIKIP